MLAIQKYKKFDIRQNLKMYAFLRRQAVGSKPIKLKVLKTEQVRKFLFEDLDEINLSIKVSIQYGKIIEQKYDTEILFLD